MTKHDVFARVGGRKATKPALSSSDRCDEKDQDEKPCKAGYTCHVVNDGAEIVMFEVAAILPTFVVH